MFNFSKYKSLALKSLSKDWSMAIRIFLMQSVVIFSSLFFLFALLCIIVHTFTSITIPNGATEYPFASDYTYFLFSTIYFKIIFVICGAIMIFSAFFMGPLKYGRSEYALQLIRNKKTSFNSTFEGFYRFKETSLTCFRIYLNLLLIYIVFLFLSILPYLITLYSSQKIYFSVFMLSLAFIFAVMIVGFVVLCYFYAQYNLVFFLIRDSEKTTASNYIKQSKELMKGNCLKLICLYITFTGWLVLSYVVACGTGNIVLHPYILVSRAYFYEDTLKEGIASGKIKYVKLINIEYEQNISN